MTGRAGWCAGYIADPNDYLGGENGERLHAWFAPDAYTGQRALEAGVLDEVQIHQIPVLLGRGARLFDELPSLIELDIVRVIDTPAATHIRYRVRR